MDFEEAKKQLDKNDVYPRDFLKNDVSVEVVTGKLVNAYVFKL